VGAICGSTHNTGRPADHRAARVRCRPEGVSPFRSQRPAVGIPLSKTETEGISPALPRAGPGPASPGG
jgi:hypothetical protein